MPDPLYTTIVSGGAISAAFALERADRPLAIHVPVMSLAAEIRLTFSQTSGGTFVNLFRPDGSGAIYVVASGVGPAIGYLDRPPSPWGQVWVASAQSDVKTFTIYSLHR